MFNKVRFANGYAATGDHDVGDFCGFGKRVFDQRRIVGNDAHVVRLAAELFQHAIYRVAIAVVNLPLTQGRADRAQFVAGGEKRNA